MSDAAIELLDLVKVYPNGVRALDSLSLTVPPGSICALLGRNGAGKTTTVRVLSTLTRQSSGQAAICGISTSERPAEVRRLIGVALQNSALDGLMTGREHLELIAGLAGYRGKDRRRRADALLELLGLAALDKRVVATYSGGMRRRLELGLALVQRPQVLFLDEMSAGLDVQSRLAVWDIIGELRADGATILLTTHDIGEASQLSDLVAIIRAGRICAAGSPAELKETLDRTVLTLHLANSADERRLALFLGDGATTVESGGVRVACASSGEQLHRLLGRAGEAGVVVDRVEIAEPSLEEVYVNLTGSELEIDSAGSGAAGIRAAQQMGVPRS